MFKRSLAAAATAATLLALATPALSAQQLGCCAVGFISDCDVIAVGANDGTFKVLQLRVSGNDISMQDLKAVYGNGAVEDLSVREEIKAGGTTRWIDLKGDRRVIQGIEMKYASRPSFKGQATVCVIGR
jgi:Protein of unknown function (DUF2541)